MTRGVVAPFRNVWEAGPPGQQGAAALGADMSKAFEKLIDKYAERRDFDRLTAFHAKRVEMLQQLQSGTYDKPHLVSEEDPVPLMDELAREIAYLEKALATRDDPAT